MDFQYSQEILPLLDKLPEPQSFYDGVRLPGSFALPDNILLFHHDFSYQAPIMHNRHTLVLPMGRMLYYIDQREFEIAPGDLLYLPPFASRYLHLQSETYHRLFITFDLKSPQHYLPVRNLNHLSAEAAGYLQKLLQLFPDGAPAELSCALLGLLTHLTPGDPPKENPRLSRKIALTVNFISQNLHTRLEIRLLAGRVNMSAGNLARRFRQEMGQSLHDYISTQRVEAARYFLEKTELHLDEIAESCGFLSGSSFSHFFTRRTGGSPLAFRKKHQIRK